MLVLSRHRDQEIQIDDDVTIKVLEIRGDQVRIGIAAPRGVAVHRGEVYEKILRAVELSAKTGVAEVA